MITTQSFFFSPFALLPVIAFVTLLHGAFLICLLIPWRSFRQLMPSHGLFLLAAFILSLLLNLIYIIGTSALSISIFSIIRFLAGLDLILLLLIFKKCFMMKTVKLRLLSFPSHI